MIEFAYHNILSDYKINWRLTSWCILCGFVGYDNNKERLIRTIKNKRVFLD